MKTTLYTLLTAGALLLLGAPATSAAPATLRTDGPTETLRKASARARVADAKKEAAHKKTASTKSRKANAKLRRTMLVALGLEESKAVTSPAKRARQLHALQKQLKAKTRQEARTRRARLHS